ncbi:class I SAM-dependent methyltransferase [Gammaproteobacteria bacterium]|nr:class I SAM-dependent methyltransferase [Gammaproteobacteria bacterium]
MLTFNLQDLNLTAGAQILDVGCGEGRHIFGSLQAFEQAYCIGYDQDLPSLEVCKEGLAFFQELNAGSTVFMQGSVYELPFADNSFDLIFCSEVLEHLDDYHLALKEIHRVLKTGGKFLPSVPSFWPEKICWSLSTDYQNMPGGHVRIFKKRQMISDITDHGFHFESSERFHGLHSGYWWLRCVFWSTQESNWMVKKYKQLLEYQILSNPWWLQKLERFLNPIFGKSIAFYFHKK